MKLVEVIMWWGIAAQIYAIGGIFITKIDGFEVERSPTRPTQPSIRWFIEHIA